MRRSSRSSSSYSSSSCSSGSSPHSQFHFHSSQYHSSCSSCSGSSSSSHPKNQHSPSSSSSCSSSQYAHTKTGKCPHTKRVHEQIILPSSPQSDSSALSCESSDRNCINDDPIMPSSKRARIAPPSSPGSPSAPASQSTPMMASGTVVMEPNETSVNSEFSDEIQTTINVVSSTSSKPSDVLGLASKQMLLTDLSFATKASASRCTSMSSHSNPRKKNIRRRNSFQKEQLSPSQRKITEFPNIVKPNSPAPTSSTDPSPTGTPENAEFTAITQLLASGNTPTSISLADLEEIPVFILDNFCIYKQGSSCSLDLLTKGVNLFASGHIKVLQH